MAKKQLEWSRHSQADRQKIAEFYATEASIFIADEAIRAIQSAGELAAKNPLHYRDGHKQDTHEYVMRRFPYIIVYRVKTDNVVVLRVLHQAMRYFN